MTKRKGNRRDVLRMAALLRQRIQDSQKLELPVLPESSWLLCQRSVRLYGKAVRKGWHAAARQIRPQLVRHLTELRRAIDRTLTWEHQQRAPTCPSLRELFGEFLGLRDEFPEVELDLSQKTISITTDPITLEYVSFGTFRIELDLKGEREPLNYKVIATEPNAASNDEDCTHPHVRNETLCEGEGTLPISRALDEGRLGDFFQIVCQILDTYNPGSAYVELDSWDGTSCVACGHSMSSDEGTRCSISGDDVCEDCSVHCPDCENHFAPDYTERCQHCDDYFCQNCLEEGHCRDCREQLHEESQEAERQTAEAPPGGSGGQCALVAERKRWDRAEGDLFIPTLRFTPYAWSKLLFLRDLGDTEVGGFGISSTHDLFLVEDVRLVRQHCTALSVAFEDEAVADFFDEQIDAGLKPERFARCWIHTHPGECPEPSGLDEDTFARVFDGMAWSVMFIVAQGGQTYARLKFGCGPKAELLVKVAIAWDVEFPGSDHAAWEEEYAQCVRPLAPNPIREPRSLSPEMVELLETYPDLMDEFGFPLLDYDDPRLEMLESEMVLHDNSDDADPC